MRGRGLGNFRGSWKQICTNEVWGRRVKNFIYESIEGSQIWFPFFSLASNCSGFWGPKSPDPPRFYSLNLWWPLSTTSNEKYMYATTITFLSWPYISAHKFAHTHPNIDIYGKYFNKLLIFDWNEMQWNQFWGWDFQLALGNQRPVIFFTRNHDYWKA